MINLFLLYSISLLKNKYVNLLRKQILSPRITKEYIEEYRLNRFNDNNLRMFILTMILFAEQLLLGLFMAEGGTVLQHIYFASSASMLCFFITCFVFLYRTPARVNIAHELFELSFAAFGMATALCRFMVVRTEIFTIPAIYIAALYGIAVIFVFGRLQIIVIYFAITSAALILIPFFHPEIQVSNFRSDIISNGIIAMIIMLMNRKRHIHSFINTKRIETINNELREQSIRDGLTGLYNRRKLDEVFGEVCMKADRYESDFSVIMIDLDHFKLINDNYGHHIGDSVLREFSRILENNIREVDVCGRWGGEEFFVICQETDIDAAAGFASRLRESVEKMKFINDLHITASFGVASWNDYSDQDSLLKEVDSRLYKAKEAGRNKVCFTSDPARV